MMLFLMPLVNLKSAQIIAKPPTGRSFTGWNYYGCRLRHNKRNGVVSRREKNLPQNLFYDLFLNLLALIVRFFN